MNLSHIQQLLLAGESEVLDYKQTISSAPKIAKSLCAFANHRGGTLLIGITDKKAIAGIRSEDEKYMIDLAAGFYCKPEIQVEISEWELQGKTILEVKIPEGKDKPYYAKDEEGKWWAYIRVKDKSLLASKIVLDVLKRHSSDRGTSFEFSSKEKFLLQYLEKNERISLPELCHMLNISRRRASRMLVNLVSIGLVRAHSTEKNEFYTLS